MLFTRAELIYDSKAHDAFTSLTVEDHRLSPTFGNKSTVNAYCAWLDKMGAAFEVRLDYELGYLLIKSNVQEIPHAQERPPTVKPKKGGIRKRTL